MKRISIASVITFAFAYAGLSLFFSPATSVTTLVQSVEAQAVAKTKTQTQTQTNLPLGNPSNAATDEKNADNYLVVHSGYTLSYNKSRGAANWVAWHLEKADVGDAERTNAFAPDQTLPRDWWIKPNDYTGSGYDRGCVIG
jgi:endonuclease G